MLIVQKYGGSSVANAERVLNVAKRIMRTRMEGHDVVVVLSAQGKTTDGLIAKAKEINHKPSRREMDMLSSLAGAECRHYSRYPGWEYAPESALRNEYIAAYKKLYGKDMTVGVIHAGLECGILSSKMSGMDIISIGPNMFDIHSPRERLDLASCERVWQTLIEVVKTKI